MGYDQNELNAEQHSGYSKQSSRSVIFLAYASSSKLKLAISTKHIVDQDRNHAAN
jgi:hypothetical protein